MTTENLKRGTELSKFIEFLNTEKGYFKRAKKITEIKLDTMTSDHRESNRYMNTDAIDFEVLRTLALKNIQTKLDEAQKEFDAL